MKTTLEQWRMLKAVVDEGGYAQAADALFKSQSTISYGVHKLQQQLGVTLLDIQGRKAVLTPQGRLLLKRAERLLENAENLDRVALGLKQGVESHIRLAVDMIYPYQRLFAILSELSQQFPDTRIELEEFALSGGNDMLAAHEVDLLITPTLPKGYRNTLVHRERFMPVCSPAHPLANMGADNTLSYAHLEQHRQIVLRDSSKKRRLDSGWLGSHQRWTVTHTSTSIDMVINGLGYAWLPVSKLEKYLTAGELVPLELGPSTYRYEDLYLITAYPDSAGPATLKLQQLLLEHQT